MADPVCFPTLLQEYFTLIKQANQEQKNTFLYVSELV